MSEQKSTERRGCRECEGLIKHTLDCPLRNALRNAVLDSERSPEQHAFRPAKNADYCLELRGINRDRFTCGQPRDAEVHPKCVECKESQWHKFECSRNGSSFANANVLESDCHCGHDTALCIDGICRYIWLNEYNQRNICGHRCTFPAPQSLTLEKYQAEYLQSFDVQAVYAASVEAPAVAETPNVYCTLASPGRGDCEHFVGLPETLDESTTDAYGKPHGWCAYCWLSHRYTNLTRQLSEVSTAHQIAEAVVYSHEFMSVENVTAIINKELGRIGHE